MNKSWMVGPMLLAALTASAETVDNEAYEQFKARLTAWTVEAEAIPSPALYKEIERLNASHQFLVRTDPKKYLWGSDDMHRSVAYAGVLNARADSGDAAASFFAGNLKWDLCLVMQRQTDDQWRKMAEECWQETMKRFRVASAAQLPEATYNAAQLYELGRGAAASKLVAAEWYARAAEQYDKARNREQALTSVEKALNLVPDLPAALRLRKQLLR